MKPKMKTTRNVARFLKLNSEIPVVSGSAYAHGGGFYRLENTEGFSFTLEECRTFPEGFPKWPWDLEKKKP